jgi:23S rRNA pseudouridine2605 synthase
VASRRTAEDLIRQGRVTVDGRPAHLGQKIDPAVAMVLIDGVPLPVRPDLVYYLLYKPLGVISTSDDDRGRTTVVDLVPDGERVYPVGRLDADSEGLLILTNDGDLTNQVTHPRHGVTKTYVARVTGVPDRTTLRRLVGGVELDDGQHERIGPGCSRRPGERPSSRS